MTPVKRPTPAVAAAAVGVLALVALYVNGLTDAFGNSDEAIYAVFIREMHHSGHYFRLVYDGAELVQRPPWSVTLYALVARVIPGEIGVRILPAMLTLCSALMAGELVRRRTGRLAIGFATAALAAGIPSMFLFGRLCMSDPPYVVASIGAMCATIAAQRNAKFIVWAGVGLGVAVGVKSVAGLLPAAALAPWLYVAIRRHRAWRPTAIAAAAFVLLAAPFYLIYYARFGQHFVDVHFGEILGDRARGALPGIGLSDGPASYLVHIWRADKPLLAILLVGGPVAAAVLAVRLRDATMGIVASYTLGVLLMLSALGTRLPHYLLVVYPAAAACVGLVLDAAIDRLPRVRPAYALVPAFLAFTQLVHAAGQGTFDESTVPAVADRAVGRVAREVIPPDQPIYTLDYYAPALAFYAQRHWRLLTTHHKMETIVGSVETFRAAGTVSFVPPWPTGTFYLAAPLMMLDAIPNQGVHSEIVDAQKDLLLLRIEITAPAVVNPAPAKP